MNIAIFSDVHANLPALERFVDLTRPVADAYLCLGDVVDYGPWNDECLQLVLSLPGIVLIEGNHERLFLGTESLTHEIPLVQTFFEHSFRHFSRSDLIRGLASQHIAGDYLCSHTIDDRRIYKDTDVGIDCNRIIGHTHHAFRVQRSGKWLINCGSVGQNRRCIDLLSYAMLRTSNGDVTLHEAEYRADLFISELVSRRYPQCCIDYYAGKRAKAVLPPGGLAKA